MLGYMEQSVATALTKALTAVGCFKPKYPFVDAKRSALLYIAYHLKGKQRLQLVTLHESPVRRENFLYSEIPLAAYVILVPKGEWKTLIRDNRIHKHLLTRVSVTWIRHLLRKSPQNW